MEQDKITPLEFYQKYCLVDGKPPVVTDRDKALFEVFDKLRGLQYLRLKYRGRP